MQRTVGLNYFQVRNFSKNIKVKIYFICYTKNENEKCSIFRNVVVGVRQTCFFPFQLKHKTEGIKKQISDRWLCNISRIRNV